MVAPSRAGAPQPVCLRRYSATRRAREASRRATPREAPAPALRRASAGGFTVRLKRPHAPAQPRRVRRRSCGRSRKASRPPDTCARRGCAQANPRIGLDGLAVGQRVRSARTLRARAHAAALPTARSDAAGVLALTVVGDQAAIPSRWWEMFNRTGVGHLMSISGLHVTMLAALAALLAAPRAAHGARGAHAAGCCAARQLAWRGCSEWRWLSVCGARRLGHSGAAHLLDAGRAGSRCSPGDRALIGRRCCVGRRRRTACSIPGRRWRPGSGCRSRRSRRSRCMVRRGVRVRAGRSRAARDRQPAAQRLRVLLLEAARTQCAATLALMPLGVLFFSTVSLVGPLANAFAIPLVSALITPAAMPPLPPAVVAGRSAPACCRGWRWSPDGCSMRSSSLAAAPPSTLVLAQPGGAVAGCSRRSPWRWCLLARTPAGATGGFAGLSLLVASVADRHRVREMRSPRSTWARGSRCGRDRASDGCSTTRALHGGDTRGRRAGDPAVAACTGNRPAGGVVVSHATSTTPAARWRCSAACASTGSRFHAGRASDRRHAVRPYHDCRRGERWRGATSRSSGCIRGSRRARCAKSPTNARSCVLRIESTGGTVLLTGDIEAAQERGCCRVLDGAHGCAADVLLAPHHGSGTSSSAEFLAAVAPASRSFAARVSQPLPTPERRGCAARYRERGIALLRSDRDGGDRGRLRTGARSAAARSRIDDRRYWRVRRPTMRVARRRGRRADAAPRVPATRPLGGGYGAGYCAVQPPSIVQAAPRTCARRAEHRNTVSSPSLLRRDELLRRLLLATAARRVPARPSEPLCCRAGVDLLLHQRREHPAGADRVAGDAGARVLERHHLGQPDDAVLGRDVGRLLGRGDQPVRRGDVDDAAPVAPLHRRAARSGSCETPPTG